MTMNDSPDPHSRPGRWSPVTGRFDVIWAVLAVAATVLGIWLGESGADISPVFTEAPFDAGGGPAR